MSFRAFVKSQMKHLDDLEAAAERLGFVLVRGEEGKQKLSAKLHEGATKCDHLLRLKDEKPGEHSIGVVAQADGTYGLVYDTWGGGRRLAAQAGGQMEVLQQEYNVAVATRRAEATLGRKGWRVERKDLPTGVVQLQLMRRR